MAGGLLGGATTATGAGAPVGVPAMVVSTTLVVGGAGNIAAGIRGLSQAMMTSGPGSSGPQATMVGASGGGPSGPVRSPNWRPRDINNPACANGCGRAAAQIQKLIGGDVKVITPKTAPTLGGYRGKNWGWSFHEVVVKDGRVYDAFTGGPGLTIGEYKALWEFPGHINFGF
jgi:hypothetical protein